MYRKPIIVAFALFTTIATYSQATQPADKVAVAIADRIISETPYTFVNTKTEQTYTSLKNVPFSMDIRVQNEYNEWHYTNGVLNIALLELADKIKTKKYEDYVFKNMNFVFDNDNLEFFKKQYDKAFSEGGWRAIISLTVHEAI